MTPGGRRGLVLGAIITICLELLLGVDQQITHLGRMTLAILPLGVAAAFYEAGRGSR